jgi:23S rRNA pseudouridine1911/1915/1917 synthase
VETPGVRADKFLAEKFPGRGRSTLARLFEDGLVRVNGKKAKKGQRLDRGDTIEVTAPPPDDAALHPVPQPELALVVRYADASLVVVDKAPGVPSHPLELGERGTLANALVARYPECKTAGQDPREAGLANRLDSGTSGLLVAARDAATWGSLREIFHQGLVTKEYLALVLGQVTRPGSITAPLAHDRADRRKVLVCEDPDEAARHGALPAETHFTVEARYRGYTLLRVSTRTGRMHQVRVHLAHLGTPVVGDWLYGIRSAEDPAVIGHFLHAARLAFASPQGGQSVDVSADLPADRTAALESLVPITP